MFPFGALMPLLLQTFVSLLTDWLFWVIVLLVAFQYRRMAAVSWQLFDLPGEPVWPSVLMAAGFGIAGGFFASLLMVFVGISVLELGISYLWITALVLMLFQQRFLCFAYAGGVISLSRLLFGFPEVSVAQLMGLVAILHMVESLLILASGHLEPLPVYVRTAQGRVVGGYNLQKFWPLPLIALLAVLVPGEEVIKGAVRMPDWWPLIKTELLRGQGEPLYVMMPVVAALGYGDIAITAAPVEKTRTAAAELAAYSFILLLMSVAASHFPALSVIPALFGPLGHEFLIRAGQRRELRGQPVFVQPERGVMVLHVLRGSPLQKAGVRRGDIILSVGGIHVDSASEVREVLLVTEGAVEVEYLAGKNRIWHRSLAPRIGGEPLGFIPAPGIYETAFLEMAGSTSLLWRWWNGARKRFR